MPSFGSTRDLEGNVFDLDNIAQEAINTSNAYTSELFNSRVPQVEHKIWIKQTLGSSGVGNEVMFNAYITAPATNWTVGPIQIHGIKNWTVDGVQEEIPITIGKSNSQERYLASWRIDNLGDGSGGEYVYTHAPVNTTLANDQTVNVRVAGKKGRTGTDVGGQTLVVVTFYRP